MQYVFYLYIYTKSIKKLKSVQMMEILFLKCNNVIAQIIRVGENGKK